MTDPATTRLYHIRNIRSGLLLPQTLKAKSSLLTFESYAEAQRWLVHIIDAPLADFEIVESDAARGSHD